MRCQIHSEHDTPAAIGMASANSRVLQTGTERSSSDEALRIEGSDGTERGKSGEAGGGMCCGDGVKREPGAPPPLLKGEGEEPAARTRHEGDGEYEAGW